MIYVTTNRVRSVPVDRVTDAPVDRVLFRRPLWLVTRETPASAGRSRTPEPVEREQLSGIS